MKLHSPVIQLANWGDAEEIALMSREYIESGLGWSWKRQRVLRCIREPEVVVAVARSPAELQGFAIMQFGDDSAHLNLLAVKTHWRRRGLGARLIRWLEESAKTAGTFDITLELRESNSAALQFYRRLGYTPVKKITGYYRSSEAAIRMTRNISVL